MTEKRFILTESFNCLLNVTFVCKDNINYMTVDETIDLLNSLLEENEQLKQKSKEHKTTLKGQSNRIYQLKKENAQLKELINMICEADSYTKRGSVKEILRDTIKSIDAAAEYSCDAWNDYCKLSKFFEKQYNEETWDNYD